jgi:hypothetical protein
MGKKNKKKADNVPVVLADDEQNPKLGKCPINVQLKDGAVKEMTLAKDCDVRTVFQKLTATQDQELALDIYSYGVDAMPGGIKIPNNTNATLQALADAEPKDAIEARLCLQAHTLYAQGMKYISRADNQDMMCHAEHYMKFALKLLRLHNETIEALNKHRRQGEQRVTVQHFHVNDGGQAAIMAGNFKAEQGNKHKQ